METIAENKTTITQKLFYEAMAAADNYRSSALKGMAVLMGGWLVLLFTLMQGFPVQMALMEFTVIAAAGVWLLVLMPRGKYKRAYQKLLSRTDDMTRTVLFYEDFCVVDPEGSKVTFAYKEIVRLRRTRHLMVFTVADKTGTFIDMDNFTKGSADALERLIRSKVSL